MANIKQKVANYMPSKKFIKVIGFGLLALGVVFLVAIFFVRKESIKNENKNELNIENRTVLDLIQSDIDYDSIPDWEEALWGTDKNKVATFGMPDAEYIAQKKQELDIEQEQVENEAEATETEKFAKQFFVAYTAMRASGKIDQETINNFSNSLGQNLVNPEIKDKYTEANIKNEKEDNKNTRLMYYTSVQTLFNKYKSNGLGDELDIVNNGLINYSSSGKEASYEKLGTIGKAYQAFASEVIKVSVPQSLAKYHLDIANSAYKTGESVINMQKVIGDPVIGLAGVSQYEKYSNEFIDTVGNLETYLSNNGDIM